MKEMKKCPMCAEENDAGVEKCPISNAELMTPQADPIDAVVEPTFGFVWKNIVTVGFYSVLLLNRFRWCAEEAMDRARVTSGLVNALMFTIGGAAFLYALAFAGVEPIVYEESGVQAFADDGTPMYGLGIGGGLSVLAELGSVVSGIICIRIAFLLRSYVKEKATRLGLADYRMNTFFLVIFNLFYINYCLNELKSHAVRNKR